MKKYCIFIFMVMIILFNPCCHTGFPENIMYSEFRRRFEILAPSEYRILLPVYDERQAVENLLEHIDIEKTSYRMGLSQVGI